jgi:hypothetical protein
MFSGEGRRHVHMFSHFRAQITPVRTYVHVYILVAISAIGIGVEAVVEARV